MRRLAFRGAGTLALAMVTCAPRPQLSDPARMPTAEVSRTDRVAAALDLPAERLQLLEAEALALAFVEGSYEIYTVRDLETGETLELSLDLSTNHRVDPDSLRKRDRELAEAIRDKLEPELFELLLAHPDLETLEVILVFDLTVVRQSDREPPKDWLEPGLRERFGAALAEELEELGVEAAIDLRDDFPWTRVSLSAHQLAALIGSDLIENASLAGPVDILD